MSEAKTGPGHTHWTSSDDGKSVSMVRHGRKEWTTAFAEDFNISARSLPGMLDRAYRMGREDQAALMRSAISYGAKP